MIIRWPRNVPGWERLYAICRREQLADWQFIEPAFTKAQWIGAPELPQDHIVAINELVPAQEE